MSADHANHSEIIDAYDSQQVKVAGYTSLAWTKERITMDSVPVAFKVKFPNGMSVLIPAHKVTVINDGFSKHGVAAPVECQVIPFRPRAVPGAVMGDRA